MSQSVVRETSEKAKVKVVIYTRSDYHASDALYSAVTDGVEYTLGNYAPLDSTRFRVSIPQELRKAGSTDYVSLILRTEEGDIVGTVHVCGYRVAEE